MKLIKTLGLTVALLGASSAAAFAGGDVLAEYDVVHDARGNVVTSTFGHCVHTRWQSGTNECAQPPAATPVVAPVREPVRQAPRVYK